MCESTPGAIIPRYQLIGCLYGMVSVHHLSRPNIGYVVHSVPNVRDLRMGENGVADCLSQALLGPCWMNSSTYMVTSSIPLWP